MEFMSILKRREEEEERERDEESSRREYKVDGGREKSYKNGERHSLENKKGSVNHPTRNVDSLPLCMVF